MTVSRTRRLRWGLLAAGSIAAQFADGVLHSDTGELVAVAAREVERAVAFASRFHILRAYGAYDELLADPDVDVVYVSTIHPLHARWAIRAAEAGKNVLCEKPLAMNADEAHSVLAAAKRNGVFLMEAFMYRCHPQTQLLFELVQSGSVGNIQLIDIAFSYDIGKKGPPRVMKRSLGGGGILDIGCYGVSLASLVVETALDHPVVEPTELVAMARLHPSHGVDLWSTALLRYPSGILARLTCAVDVVEDNHVRVFGTEGQLHIPVPSWLTANRMPGTSHIHLRPRGGSARTLDVHAAKRLFTYEADAVAEYIRSTEHPLLPWAGTLANMRTLDRWRDAVGVSYEADEKRKP
jgi:predicted dehydrogenase